MILILVLVFIVPLLYRENFLDPFSTLNVPNRILHPNSFNKVGVRYPSDPFNPRYIDNTSSSKDLIHALSSAKPVASGASEADLTTANKLYLTLHCQASSFHESQDYALVYYSGTNFVYFGNQLFKINDATTRLMEKIITDSKPGWWS